jgi:hypothetical protein
MKSSILRTVHATLKGNRMTKTLALAVVLLGVLLDSPNANHGNSQVTHIEIHGRDRQEGWQGAAENYDRGGEASHRHKSFEGSGGGPETQEGCRSQINHGFVTFGRPYCLRQKAERVARSATRSCHSPENLAPTAAAQHLLDAAPRSTTVVTRLILLLLFPHNLLILDGCERRIWRDAFLLVPF